jgi:hypothetical protein
LPPPGKLDAAQPVDARRGTDSSPTARKIASDADMALLVSVLRVGCLIGVGTRLTWTQQSADAQRQCAKKNKLAQEVRQKK